MPKDVYFTAVVFSSFFLLFFSEVTERISTKLGHIFTYDCCLKKIWSELPRAFIPPWARGKKNTFFGLTLNFDRTYLCKGTCYKQSERNTSIYRDSPTCPQNLVNFGAETAENGWRVFAHPLIFLIGRHCQPYRMDAV